MYTDVEKCIFGDRSSPNRKSHREANFHQKASSEERLGVLESSPTRKMYHNNKESIANSKYSVIAKIAMPFNSIRGHIKEVKQQKLNFSSDFDNVSISD